MSVSNGPNLGKMISALDGDAFPVDFRKLLRAIDVLLQGAVISKTLTAPPGSPANGDRYIVGASPTGAWSGQAKSIAVWTTDNPAMPSGLWEFYPPKSGWLVANIADSTVYVYLSSAWTALAGGGGSTTLAALTDVLLSSPANGDVLTYNIGASKWENAPPAGGGGGFTVDFSNDGSSLTGWTTGGSVAVTNSSSSPSVNPSALQPAAATSNFAHIDTGVSLAGKTILVDVLSGSTSDLAAFIFGADSSGAGPGFQFDTRGGSEPGAALTQNTAWVPSSYIGTGAVEKGRFASLAGIWTQVKVVIDGPGTTAKLYVNGVLCRQESVTLSGTFIGINGGGGSSGALFRNFVVGH
jgi:hypothetical protein